MTDHEISPADKRLLQLSDDMARAREFAEGQRRQAEARGIPSVMADAIQFQAYELALSQLGMASYERRMSRPRTWLGIVLPMIIAGMFVGLAITAPDAPTAATLGALAAVAFGLVIVNWPRRKKSE